MHWQQRGGETDLETNKVGNRTDVKEQSRFKKADIVATFNSSPEDGRETTQSRLRNRADSKEDSSEERKSF